MKRKECESIEWDEKRGGVIITKQERIEIQDTVGIADATKKIETRLAEIIKQVKVLKEEAETLKKIRDKLKGRAVPVDPALDQDSAVMFKEANEFKEVKESRSPSAVIPDSM